MNGKTIAQDKREIDDNGWFEVKNNPLSKEGIFLYRGSQIRLPDGSQPPDLDKLYPVYRPAEELSNEETINSFKLVPWVDNHAMLGSEEMGMTPAEKKGVSGVIGQEVYFKGGVLYGNIKAFSETLAKQIENGKKELSLGYHCRYEHNPGEWNGQHYEYIQRDLRGNHLALVDNGRMGAGVRVLDHCDLNIEQFIFTCDSQMERKMKLEQLLELLISKLDELKKSKTIDTDNSDDLPPTDNQNDLPPIDEQGDEVNLNENGDEHRAEDDEDPNQSEAHPIDKLITIVENLAKKVELLENKINGNSTSEDDDNATEDKDDEDADEDSESKKSDYSAMDAAEIAKRVSSKIAERDKLYSRVSKFTGAFDCSAMDTADVAAYGCRKLGLKPEKGQALAMITGYMAHRKPDSEKKTVSAMDSADSSFIDKQLSQ